MIEWVWKLSYFEMTELIIYIANHFCDPILDRKDRKVWRRVYDTIQQRIEKQGFNIKRENKSVIFEQRITTLD